MKNNKHNNNYGYHVELEPTSEQLAQEEILYKQELLGNTDDLDLFQVKETISETEPQHITYKPNKGFKDTTTNRAKKCQNCIYLASHDCYGTQPGHHRLCLSERAAIWRDISRSRPDCIINQPGWKNNELL